MDTLVTHIVNWRSLPADSPEELQLREAIIQRIQQLESAEREATVLKRIGTAFKLHQTVQPSALHASHSIRGALNLLAVRVWVSKNGKLTAIATAQDRPGRQNIPLTSAPEHVTHIATWEIWDTCFRALLPLQVATEKLGYLELFAPLERESFLTERDLHQTVAEQLSLVIESAILFEHTETMATTDPLTGLCNHRTLQDFLGEQCEEVRRHRHKVGVVMVDVDHFRLFNETYGHDAGDDVLRRVAKALQRAVGEKGMAARYGGEEFTLILPGADDQTTEIIALSALDLIRKVVFVAPDGIQKPITASLGYATAPNNGIHPQKILKIADLALYASKHNGRNQVSGPNRITEESNKAA
ncbi:MAG: GGDEF domain-containing protein [Fimbriimonadaceae bacterium]